MAGTLSMGASLTLKKAGDETDDTVFANLTSIGAIEGEKEEIDVTTLDSPNRAKEFISGGSDFGTVDVEMNVTADKTTQIEKVNALFSSGAVREWVRTDDTGSVTFTGYVSNTGYGEETTDGKVTYTFAIRVSGQPTFAGVSD